MLTLEEQAKSKLSGLLYDYFAGGSGEEISLNENHFALQKIKMRGPLIGHCKTTDMSCSLPGAPLLSFPCIIAPMGFIGLIAPEAEEQMANACMQCGIRMTASSLSIAPMEYIANAAKAAPPWFQLYALKDIEKTISVVRRAKRAGFSALCLTIDAPLFAKRPRDIRNGFGLPKGTTLGNLSEDILPDLHSHSQESLLQRFADIIAPCTPASLIQELVYEAEMPVWIKGILHPQDAIKAIECGAAGIIVSNHGGRQLDCAPSSVDVLSDMRSAVGPSFPVIVDGGFRSGSDIAKALALGADAVMIGREALWALAAGGQKELLTFLQRTRDDFGLTLRLLGCESAKELRERGHVYLY